MDKYDELVQKTEKRMDEIDDELVVLAQNFKGSEMTAIHLLKLASNAEKLFKSSKPAVKNQILRLLVSNLKISQKKLSFELLEPFKFLYFTPIKSTILDAPTTDSHNKIGRTRGVVRPIWLPRPDSNWQPRS